MNSSREEALLALALEKPAEKRPAFLDAMCEGNLVLRARLEALLAAHEQPDTLLSTQAVGRDEFHKSPSKNPGLAELGPPIELPDEAVGQTLGRYKLLERVGEGGCGVVYVAEQTEPVRRRVALKVIKLGMDTKQVVARFEAERQALAMMDHPNIAKVLDAGTTDVGRPYFVMELVRGIRITDYCDQAQVSTKDRLDLFMKVCHAIQHAHQKGIIHRDIKPSNILVTLHDGVPVPKVIDFGIAKATEGRLTDNTVYTQLHQFIGTPAYMSPEQAEMSGLDIDTRSDIYSLGVLLYELLAGSTPFDAKELMASGIDVMRKTIREKEPQRPSTKLIQTLLAAETVGRVAPRAPSSGEGGSNGGAHGVTRPTLKSEEEVRASSRRLLRVKDTIHQLQGDLDWIVMKCLEKDRSRRYDTANGLAADLKRHLNNEPVVARPPSTAYRFQKAFRRNKLVFTAGAAIAVALLLGIIATSLQSVRATRAKRDAVAAQAGEEAQRLEAQKAQANEAQQRRAAEVQELAARREAYASDMNLANQSIAQNNFGRAQELLNRHRPASKSEVDLRGWEWRYLWQFCKGDDLFTLCRQARTVFSLASSRDGRWLAVGGEENGGLSVWDLRTRQEIPRPDAGKGLVAVAFSPREALLAFSTETQPDSRNSQYAVHLWDVMTRQLVATLPVGGQCLSLAFAEDGRRLITFATSPEAVVTLWSVPDGRKLASVSAAGMRRQTIHSATRDLRMAAYGIDEDRIRVIDLATGQERWTVKAADELVTGIAFSPDGKVLASSAGYVEGTIKLWDVASGREIGRLEGHRSWVSTLVFWPDGKTLASASSDQTIRLWDISDPAKARPRAVLRGHNCEVWSLTLLPDNATLVSGGKDGTVRMWDTTSIRGERTFTTLPGNVLDWRFAPDSKSLITLAASGQVTRWKGDLFDKAEPLASIEPSFPSQNAAYFILLARDGRQIATGSTNGLVRVWDVGRGALTRELPAQNAGSRPMAFLPESRRLIVRHADDSVHEWDLLTGQEMQSWQGAEATRVWAVSPDERWCVTFGTGGASVLRDLSTLTQTNLGVNWRQASGASFSPDGKTFAVVSWLGIGKVWAIDPPRELWTFRGFLLGIDSVAFSADGSRIAAGSGGKEVLKLWDVASHQEVLTLEAEGSTYYQTAFSADGNVIGSRNGLGVLHLWRAPSWEEIAAAEAKEKAELKQP